MKELRTDVVVVGGGPAGLSAATALRADGSTRVTVVERETELGGIPRHSDHPGYGMRDRRRFMSGPRYARVLAGEALAAGVEAMTRSMVTSFGPDDALHVTTPDGRVRLTAGAVVLATGARERPRPARGIPGGRPAGVYTTGELQNLVHLHHRPVGTRAVVVGGELVSWSAVMTLKEAGCHTEALVTRHRAPESYAVFNLGGRAVFRPAVATRSRVTQVLGRHRVTGVELEDLDTGVRRVVECDTVVFTGDWIPDNELARSVGLDLDPGSLAPRVDQAGLTDRPGFFAAGNLVHPVDTADVAALGGTHVAAAVRRHLDGASFPSSPGLPIVAAEPFRWVSPGVLRVGAGAPARDRVVSWVSEHVGAPRVTVRQDGVVLARRRLAWPASPGRAFRLPWALFADADPARGPVEVSL
jgi:thioredoxin reductase